MTGPIPTHHHPRRHAAVRTDEYLFSQLIPYIGNKRRLLPLLNRAITHTRCRHGTFVDLFAGSTVVARLAKKLGFRVVANDWEPYAYEIARGTVALSAPPPFATLGGVARVFDHLNTLPPRRGWVATHLCPHDDEHVDPARERLFFTRANGERIDAIRDEIEAWERAGRLTSDERAYLLAPLLYAVSYASNTSGVFKGFHHGWGGKTATALYRIRGRLRLVPPVLYDNGHLGVALREDAQRLAGRLAEVTGARPDLVYLDPPYNQHPYGSNYHVLTSVALWDKPAVNPSIVVNGRQRDKSAIRTDWRTERRSPFNTASIALSAWRKLIASIDARWILVSYSTDGNVPVERLLDAMTERGDVELFLQPYKRYRVSTPRMSRKSHNVEFVAVLDTEGTPCSRRAEILADRVHRREAAALAEP